MPSTTSSPARWPSWFAREGGRRFATPCIAGRPPRPWKPSSGSSTRGRCSVRESRWRSRNEATGGCINTVADARDFVLGRPLGLVLKADGLAAGKGVYVCNSLRQALEAVDQIMIRRIFGQAGDRLIIEERLDGHECSVLALTDGRTIIPLESSQDYKRAFDHDEGPNTGGMGAFSPTPRVTPGLMEEVEREILVPIVHALKRARRPFRGVIYAGLMLTNQGPKVLEFNVRFGDPETQVVLMRLKSDLLDALEAVVDERLDSDRPGVGSSSRGDRGHGLGRVSRPLRARPSDREPGGGRSPPGREGLSCGNHPPDRVGQRPRSPGGQRRRTGAERDGAGRHAGRGA